MIRINENLVDNQLCKVSSTELVHKDKLKTVSGIAVGIGTQASISSFNQKNLFTSFYSEPRNIQAFDKTTRRGVQIGIVEIILTDQIKELSIRIQVRVAYTWKLEFTLRF